MINFVVLYLSIPNSDSNELLVKIKLFEVLNVANNLWSNSGAAIFEDFEKSTSLNREVQIAICKLLQVTKEARELIKTIGQLILGWNVNGEANTAWATISFCSLLLLS